MDHIGSTKEVEYAHDKCLQLEEALDGLSGLELPAEIPKRDAAVKTKLEAERELLKSVGRPPAYATPPLSLLRRMENKKIDLDSLRIYFRKFGYDDNQADPTS